MSSADVSDRQPGPHPPAVPFVHVTGSWAFTTTQVNSEVVGTSLGGCKCSASAAAPSTPCHGYLPVPLASTADFMTHFVELNSDLPDLCLLTTVASSKHLSPASSTFSANSLLWRGVSEAPLVCAHSRTSHATWLAKEGLAPIPKGYSVPGYVPAAPGGLPSAAVLGGVPSASLARQEDVAGASMRDMALHGQQSMTLHGQQPATLHGQQPATLHGQQPATLHGQQLKTSHGQQLKTLHGQQYKILHGQQFLTLLGLQSSHVGVNARVTPLAAYSHSLPLFEQHLAGTQHAISHTQAPVEHSQGLPHHALHSFRPSLQDPPASPLAVGFHGQSWALSVLQEPFVTCDLPQKQSGMSKPIAASSSSLQHTTMSRIPVVEPLVSHFTAVIVVFLLIHAHIAPF